MHGPLKVKLECQIYIYIYADIQSSVYLDTAGLKCRHRRTSARLAQCPYCKELCVQLRQQRLWNPPSRGGKLTTPIWLSLRMRGAVPPLALQFHSVATD